MLIPPTPSRDDVGLKDFDPAFDAKIENARPGFDLTLERTIEPSTATNIERSD